MITGIIRTEENTKYSKEVAWSFHDFETRIFEEDNVLNDVIVLRHRKWRVLLHTVDLLGSRYISVSLSSVPISDNISNFSSTSWHAGILDKDGVWQYDRSGVLRHQTISSEWIAVADWSGPEWKYMCEEKDLYMPNGRFTFALQFHWGPKCLQKSSHETKMKTLTVSINGEDYDHYSKSAFWMVDEPRRKLEESKTLLSDTFSFGGQFWRLSLHTVEEPNGQHTIADLSRVTISNQHPPFPSVFWRSGFVARDGTSKYVSRGMTTMETSSERYPVTVPEAWNMCLDRYAYVPRDRLTVVVQLRWTPENLVSNIPSIPSYSIILKVRGVTFHIHRSILETFSPVLHAMACENDLGEASEFLHLHDCDPTAFEIFLHFAYLGDIEEMSGELIKEVYYFAERYEVLQLKEECTRRLLATMTAESVCCILDLAERHGDLELRENAAEFVVANARDVFRSNAWLQFMAIYTKLANDLIIRSYDKSKRF